MKGEALRRRDRQRAIVKAGIAYPGHAPEKLKKLANNRKPCSCWMCGNPRRFAKGASRLTIQELRAMVVASHEGDQP